MKNIQDRRRRLNLVVDKDFQYRFSLKIILVVGFIFALFGGTFLFLIRLNYDMLIQDALIQMPDMVDSLRREFRLISFGMIGAFLFMMIAVFGVSLYMSLNVAGPLYAFRKRLKEFADGKSGLRMHLRTRDEFQSLEEVFNLAMENHDLRQRQLKENIDRTIASLGNKEPAEALQILRDMKKDLPEKTFLF